MMDNQWTRNDRKAALALAVALRDVAYRHGITPTAFALGVKDIVLELEGDMPDTCTPEMREMIAEWRNL